MKTIKKKIESGGKVYESYRHRSIRKNIKRC